MDTPKMTEGKPTMIRRLFVLILVAALASLVVVVVARLLDKGRATIEHPQPMRPAAVVPCPAGYAMIALRCVAR